MGNIGTPNQEKVLPKIFSDIKLEVDTEAKLIDAMKECVGRIRGQIATSPALGSPGPTMRVPGITEDFKDIVTTFHKQNESLAEILKRLNELI